MIQNNYVVTSCGPVQGSAAAPGISAFRGIRYATAGRWQYPVVTTQWEGVWDASHFGPNAIQGAAFKAEDETSFYCHEFRAGLPYTYSEDCQYLNIYAPDHADHAPVIVYIHGGAYMGGSGWDKVFNFPKWPEAGVVGVTLNYRLGLFGNLILPELIEEAGHAGNYNVYDQLAALKWIKANIEAFGGDPENITIMGQSAGARSVQVLSQSPEMIGIAKRAVMSSGGGMKSNLFDRVPSTEEAMGAWAAWREAMGNPSLEELRAMPAEQIINSVGILFQKNGFQNGILYISPVYDEQAFPKPGTDPRLPDGCLEIPYLLGGNSEDMVPGLAEDARVFTKDRPVNSYAYSFSRQLPGDEAGAWHSADLWYWFGTLENCWRPFTEEDYKLSDTMRKYLINFATTGDPNGQGLPHWEPSQNTGQIMQLDTSIGMIGSVAESKAKVEGC